MELFALASIKLFMVKNVKLAMHAGPCTPQTAFAAGASYEPFHSGGPWRPTTAPVGPPRAGCMHSVVLLLAGHMLVLLLRAEEEDEHAQRKVDGAQHEHGRLPAAVQLEQRARHTRACSAASCCQACGGVGVAGQGTYPTLLGSTMPGIMYGRV